MNRLQRTDLSQETQPGESPTRIGRWQISLRQLLILFAATAVVLALFDWREWHVSAAVVLVSLVVAMVLSRPKVRYTLIVILICVYAPYGWLLQDYPWRDYRWGWIGMWPILPGIIPGGYFFHAQNDFLEFSTMALVALLCISLATAIAVRGKWFLISTAVIVLALSIANSFVAYALFRA